MDTPRNRPSHIRLAFALMAVGYACTSPVAARAQAQAIRFGTLVVGNGEVVADAVVVVEGDRVISVGTGDAAVPPGARVTDLRAYTGIPGLIDVHTHITYWRARPEGATELGSGARGAGRGLGAGQLGARSAQTPTVGGQRTDTDRLAGAAENARFTLETGVTTIRDLGASNFLDLAVRDSIASGAMIGPRVFAAGHGLSKLTNPPREGETSGAPRGRVRDIAEIQIAVRAQVEAGADWIKMYGSTGSFENVTGRQTFSFEEMRAAADAAHAAGKPIAIHSYGPEGARDAMRAGAESVEHAADVDDAVLAEWARTRTIYVPTIDHNRFYAENADNLDYSPEEVADLRAFIARNLDTARRAHAAGVRFAMGSDAVYWMHGENTAELGWFVQAGMTPAEALATATSNAAELLGASTTLGQVAPGFFADIVAVEGDPLADIGVVLNGVRWVMKGGAVVVDNR